MLISVKKYNKRKINKKEQKTKPKQNKKTKLIGKHINSNYVLHMIYVKQIRMICVKQIVIVEKDTNGNIVDNAMSKPPTLQSHPPAP